MSRLDDAKQYAMANRYDAKTPAQLARATVARYGLTRGEASRLHAWVNARIVNVDRTLCGSASLRALRLPLNRIAEAFQ